jgi:ATP-dependent helicase/nuclease subunit B
VSYRARLVNDKPGEKTKTPADVGTLREMEFSAQSLDTYLACPLRFYYRYVLHLSDREDLTEELDAADVGKLVHAILARYMEPLRDKALTVADLSRERLTGVIDACFREMFGGQLTGTAMLMRRQVEKRLTQFLEEHQVPLVTKQNVHVVGVEQKLEAEYKGHSFIGRVDRIERMGDRVAIIDYKTGGDKKTLAIRSEKIDPSEPDTWRSAIPSFQLPMYMLLYSRASQEELASIDPSYLLLGNKELDEESELALGDENSTAQDVFHAVEPVLMKVIEMILDPAVPFSATSDLEQECPRCPFNTICGTQWVRGWKPT